MQVAPKLNFYYIGCWSSPHKFRGHCTRLSRWSRDLFRHHAGQLHLELKAGASEGEDLRLQQIIHKIFLNTNPNTSREGLYSEGPDRVLSQIVRILSIILRSGSTGGPIQVR